MYSIEKLTNAITSLSSLSSRWAVERSMHIVAIIDTHTDISLHGIIYTEKEQLVSLSFRIITRVTLLIV